VVSSLNHDQLGELYTVRAELEGLAARLAAQHAAPEEVRVLWEMIRKDRELLDRPDMLARANKRFHRQIHLASHNRYLVQQLEMVHRSMALVSNTTLAVEGRGQRALEEHEAVVRAIEAHDGEAADSAIRTHISRAFETRLIWDAERYA
jgi:DNA-binding GntR family transcriptional regulator